MKPAPALLAVHGLRETQHTGLARLSVCLSFLHALFLFFSVLFFYCSMGSPDSNKLIENNTNCTHAAASKSPSFIPIPACALGHLNWPQRRLRQI